MKTLFTFTLAFLLTAPAFAGTAVQGNFCGRILDDGDSLIVQDGRYDAKIYLYDNDATEITSANKSKLSVGGCFCVNGVVNDNAEYGVHFLEVRGVVSRPDQACR
jgi:hypothetical protein